MITQSKRRSNRPHRQVRWPSRGGMSLAELIVALVILGGSLLALAKFAGTMAQTAGNARIQTNALWLATDRIEAAKSYPNYGGIDSVFLGTETTIAGQGNANFKRQTLVQRIGGVAPDTIDDYKVITVIVTHPQLAKPIRKSTFIAAF